MANTQGPSAPPIMQIPEVPPPGDPHATVGISSPGSIVGKPPAIDPVVATLLGKLRGSHGMGYK